MRIVLTKEAYAKFSQEAKALGLTTRELGEKVIIDYVNTK